MKKLTYLIIFNLFVSFQTLLAQDFGGDKVGLGNFVRRMYFSQPFNGVKLLQSQEGQDYMVSVVELMKDSSKSESILSRIAIIKAKSYVSQYINGSNVSTDIIIVTTEEKGKDSVITKTTMQEMIKESSVGYVDGMEYLVRFSSSNGTHDIYVFYKKIKR